MAAPAGPDPAHPLGAGLQVAVNAVKAWAEIHMDEIEAAGSAYDAATLQ